MTTSERAKVERRHSVGAYRSIENYGVIGNLHTVALVSTDGSIDWCCLPHFDSPSVFGALLDAGRGGYFRIASFHASTRKQMYLPDSNILVTRFLSAIGVGEILDFMPIEAQPEQDINLHHLYRIVRAVRGTVRFRLECLPAFNYGRTPHRLLRPGHCVVFQTSDLRLALHTPVPLADWKDGVAGEFTLHEGQSLTFVLRHVENGTHEAVCATPDNAHDAFDRTLAYWQGWAGRLQYQGRWREVVTRSALCLKMLTFAPTGAIVAAATTSLPEVPGGTRNWDYRYTWIRDASFTLYALLRLGYSGEAEAFMGWLKARLGELGPDGSLNIMYGLHGEHDLREEVLDQWEGYHGSRPVRIGNAAFNQRQMDIYGELMDSVYLYNKHGSPISYELWERLQPMLDFVCRHWHEKDKGIWETRGPAEHFVYSKVMCWVALDRALRMALKRRLPGNLDLWGRTCNAIYLDVMKNGWNAKIGSFVQYYGTTALDASTLIMPLVKFISPTDPRMISTLERIRQQLVTDSLVRRYQVGAGVGRTLKRSEGTFSMCTFWYVEALARAGQIEQARWIFEKMLGYANHLGLYAEELGPTGHQLGNFPQAFTHLGLISAAINLDKALQRHPARQNSPPAFSLFAEPETTSDD